MKLVRSFIKGRMNKSVDERLLPDGEYIDALNVRVGNTELTDIGSLENTKGNAAITTLSYGGQALSSQAICIGAFEDGANETLYWFVHDPANPVSSTNIADLIVSFNVSSSTLTYIVQSIDDGSGIRTALNFNPKYLINGVNIIEDLLFFTDNYNPPKQLNVKRSYGASLDNGNEHLIYVIKKPPMLAPTINLLNTQHNVNYLEDRFVSFAYRYKYQDGQYSSLSPFTQIAFDPRPFFINTDNFTNSGMLNEFNAVDVTVNTGPEDVVGYDICFKFADDNFIRVVERVDKDLPDNTLHTIAFDNSKTYTILPESEVLRLFDNVPRLAQAQTLMGNRIMYGNYLEGYDLTTSSGALTNMDYILEQNGEAINFNAFTTSFASGAVSILGNSQGTFTNQTVTFDLSNAELNINTIWYFSINIEHHNYVTQSLYTPPPAIDAPTGGNSPFTIELTYTLPQTYATVYDVVNSSEFRSAIGANLTNTNPAVTNIQQVNNCALGGTLTDVYNCNISTPKTSASNTWTIFRTGYNGSNGGESIYVPSSPGNNTVSFRILAASYKETTNLNPLLAETFQITGATGYSQNVTSNKSLHTDRNYEVGIAYLDEFGRQSTVQVSENNSVYVPCSAVGFKNTLVANIPISQQAPSWAKFYRWYIKPDRYLYQTIYATNWYAETGTNITWIQLEGENQQKVEVGDFLRPKADVNGPIDRCCEVEVLDKQNKERNFLTGTDPSNVEVTNQRAGVYMKVKESCFSADNSLTQVFTSGNIDVTSKKDRDTNGASLVGSGDKDYLFVDYPVYSGSAATATRWTVEAGDIVDIYVRVRRDAQKKCKDTCGAKESLLGTNDITPVSIVSSANYPNFQEFFEGEGLVARWQNSPDDTIDCIDDAGSGAAVYYSTLAQGTSSGTFQIDPGSDSYLALQGTSQIQFYEVPNATAGQDYLFMRVVGGYPFCSGRKKGNSLEVEIVVTKNPNTIVFETIPTDANADLYYESAETYGIDANGNHLGITANNDVSQDIAAGTEGVINLDFYNCFTFGNGVESFRILDSLSQQFFLFGNRTNITTDENYRAIRRFADVTYSGTYSQEQNINRLNEFNLGLANFKTLEQTFGDIQVLDARETDMLVLQEDRISYVLVGKNLLSDSTGGGAITSVPEVLGTQIARTEKYGISFNPESYVQWGREKFFTDAKRGVVLKLDGAGQAEKLDVVSEVGMDSWFRDLFQGSFYTQKLGGYDPYMDEYILHSNETEIPINEPCFSCGGRKEITVTAGQVVRFCVDYDSAVGSAVMNYTEDLAGSDIDIKVTYNSIDTTQTNVTASGSISFNKDIPHIQTADIVITGNATVSTFTFNFACPVPKTLNVISVCVTSQSEAGQSIHNGHSYLSSTVFSPLNSQAVVFGSGSFPIVSQYQVLSGAQGTPSIPIDGSIVFMSSRQISPDNFVFDTATDNFAYLVSSTEYTNTPADINTLLSLATPVTTDTSNAPQTYRGSFTMPASSTNDYLYLVFDYRQSTLLDLCYDGSSIDDVCCECTTCTEYKSFSSTRPLADFTTICSVPVYNQTYYHDGTGTLPEIGDNIFLDQSGTSLGVLAPGWFRLSTSPNEICYVETVGSNTRVTSKQLC